MTRVVRVALLLLSTAACAPAAPTGPLQPLMLGWEQHFTIESHTAPRGEGVVVWGYLATDSPYTFRQIRVLVDALDPSNQVAAQGLAWVFGTLSWPNRLYFEVPMPPAPAYRVAVFSYDRVESERRRPFW